MTDGVPFVPKGDPEVKLDLAVQTKAREALEKSSLAAPESTGASPTVAAEKQETPQESPSQPAPPSPPSPAQIPSFDKNAKYKVMVGEKEVELTGEGIINFAKRGMDLDDSAAQIEQNRKLFEVAQALDRRAQEDPSVYDTIEGIIQGNRPKATPPAPAAQPVAPSTQANSPTKVPETQLEERLRVLEQEISQRKAWEAEQVRRSAAMAQQKALESQIEKAMSAFPVFKDPKISDFAKKAAKADYYENQGRKSPEKIVAETASSLNQAQVSALETKIVQAAEKQEAKTGVGPGLSPTTVPGTQKFSAKDLEEGVNNSSNIRKAVTDIFRGGFRLSE